MHASPDPSDAGVLRVASFNVRNGRAWDGVHTWPLRAWSLASAVRDLDADVVGLQEAYAFQERWLLRCRPGYSATGTGRGADGGGERTSVLHRVDRLRVVTAVTRWFGDQPAVPGTRLPGATFPRTATLVELHDGAGRAFGVANTHLDEHRADHRRRSVDQLVEWLDGWRSERTGHALPWIVTGDLNEEPDGAVASVLSAAGFVDTLPADGPGTDHRFTGRTDGPRIDYVLVRGPWDVMEARVAASRTRWPLPSDHWPVRATLRWVPGTER